MGLLLKAGGIGALLAWLFPSWPAWLAGVAGGVIYVAAAIAWDLYRARRQAIEQLNRAMDRAIGDDVELRRMVDDFTARYPSARPAMHCGAMHCIYCCQCEPCCADRERLVQ